MGGQGASPDRQTDAQDDKNDMVLSGACSKPTLAKPARYRTNHHPGIRSHMLPDLDFSSLTEAHAHFSLLVEGTWEAGVKEMARGT